VTTGHAGKSHEDQGGVDHQGSVGSDPTRSMSCWGDRDPSTLAVVALAEDQPSGVAATGLTSTRADTDLRPLDHDAMLEITTVTFTAAVCPADRAPRC
jgi:hypothetical protein